MSVLSKCVAKISASSKCWPSFAAFERATVRSSFVDLSLISLTVRRKEGVHRLFFHLGKISSMMRSDHEKWWIKKTIRKVRLENLTALRRSLTMGVRCRKNMYQYGCLLCRTRQNVKKGETYEILRDNLYIPLVLVHTHHMCGSKLRLHARATPPVSAHGL